MAKDLILGRTSRDWSCGSLEARQQAAEDLVAQMEVGPLADLVEREIQQCFREVARLHAAGRMPADRRKSLGALMRRWHSFKESRQGRYEGRDYVELADFRDEVRRRRAEVEALEQRATTPSDQDRAPCQDCSRSTPLVAKLLGISAVLGASYLAARHAAKFMLAQRRTTP